MPGLSGEQKQDAYYTEAQLLQARRVDRPYCGDEKGPRRRPRRPESVADQGLYRRLEATVEAEKAALKLKAQLENIEAERLKVLDETIQAYTKANYRVGGKDERQLVQEWMQEAIRLDPDNAAGMKAKYEYLSLYLEGQNLLQSGKAKEAVAVIEKALALPDITPDADIAGGASEVQLLYEAEGLSGPARLRRRRPRRARKACRQPSSSTTSSRPSGRCNGRKRARSRTARRL